MFSNNLVMCVKVNGEFLAERNQSVYLPFGCEYSIYLKNASPQKALVNLSVDGRSIIDNLVIAPLSSLEIERFFEGNNDKGHKLKFIEKTKEIEAYRGNKPEDGLLSCTFSFEKKQPYYAPQFDWSTQNFEKWQSRKTYVGDIVDDPNIPQTIMLSNVSGTRWSKTHFTFADLAPTALTSCVQGDAGITVNGGVSEQQFSQVETFTTGKRYSITLMMFGFTPKDEKKVNASRQQRLVICPTCGKRAKHQDNFCSRCGTNLQVL